MVLGRSDDEFWGAPLCKIYAAINMKLKETRQRPAEPTVAVNSMREIPGWC